jgi:hypothetical protein
MVNDEEVIRTLGEAAEDAVGRYKGTQKSQDPMAQQKMAQAGVLASYATWRIQQETLGSLKEQTQLLLASANAQSETIRQMAEQTRWTKRLAKATIILALATMVLAVLALASFVLPLLTSHVP